jgi:hypothetical protein
MDRYLRVNQEGDLTDTGVDAGGRIHWTPARLAPTRTLVKVTPAAIVVKVAGQSAPARRNFIPASRTPATYAVYRVITHETDAATGATVYTVEPVIEFPVRS